MELILFLLFMIVFAVLAIFSRTLKSSVIYLGIFSLTSALVYLFINAPDVAMVEAVIGSVLTTILFLVAIQKCKVLSMYFASETGRFILSRSSSKEYRKIMKDIRNYCNKHELELQIVYTNENAENFLVNGQKDILVVENNKGLSIYLQCNNESVRELQNSISEKHTENVSCIYMQNKKGKGD